MSDSLAVATTTAALANQLARFIGETGNAVVPGARVTTLNPGNPALRDGDPLVNLYLFRIARNGFTSNRDLPTRSADGHPLASPTVSLDLDYMITFFGDDSRLEPQRLLGSVVAWLNAEPCLDRALIEATIEHNPWLAGSTLAGHGRQIRIMPMNFPADAMARLWSEFVNVPYQLTALYTASAVNLTVPFDTGPARPVRRIGMDVRPAGPLPVRGAVNADQPDLPVVAGGKLAVRIANPHRPGLRVHLNGAAASKAAAGRDAWGHAALIVPLDGSQAAPLATGSLQVQMKQMGSDGREVLAVSPPLAVPLHPAFAAQPRYDATDKSITVTLALPVPARDSPTLLLFPETGANAVTLSLPPVKAPTDILVFPAAALAAGRYLATIESAGLQSLLDYAGGRYVGPLVDVGPPHE